MQTPLKTTDTTLDEKAVSRSPDDSTLDEQVAPPTSISESRNPVDLLADEFSARLRASESPSIDEYVRRAPDREAAIRAVFPSIAMMEGISHREHSERQAERRLNRLTLNDGETLGDVRIVREIGRGGMGIVYEAEQQSLKRRCHERSHRCGNSFPRSAWERQSRRSASSRSRIQRMANPRRSTQSV